MMFKLDNMIVPLQELEAMEQAVIDMAWPLEIFVISKSDSTATISIEFGTLDMLLSLGLLGGRYSQLKTKIN